MTVTNAPATLEDCSAVLFDYEGTLAILDPPHRKLAAAYSSIQALLPDGSPHDLHTPEAVAHLHMEIFSAVLAARDTHPDEEPDVLSFYSNAYTSHGVSTSQELVHRIYLIEQHAWGSGAREVDGALTTLALLRERGYAIGLASNASYPEAVMLQLASLGMLSHLDSISLSGLTRIRKPDPAVFTDLAVELGSDPSRAVMVGDRMREDVTGARNAGLTGILYCPTVTPGAPEEAVPQISDLRDLLDLLPGAVPS